MPPRAMWKGQLRLSLVSFGVRMYSATESGARVSLNQLHADCHQRVKNQLTCPVHGPITRDEIVKGYEYEKDSYVLIDEEDLANIRLESTKTIDLVQFVDEGEIDPLYYDSSYFIGPDGPVAEEAFSVIREAMKRAGKVGLGKVVMRSREQVVALSVEGRGFLLSTLRYADEVRQPKDYFSDIRIGDVDEEQVALATSIIESKAKAFDPGAFSDEYREKFFELVKAKLKGAEPVLVDEDEPAQSFNFMEALKQSVEDATGKAPAKKAASKSTTKKKTARKKTAKKPAAKSASGASKKKTKKRA